MPIREVDPDLSVPFPTQVSELDRVLSGGLVPGSVTLIGGEPGIGKSTLVLQAIGSLAAAGRRTLLVAAEESAEQVRRRAERLGALAGESYVVATTELSTALEAAGRLEPDVVVVDSIQAVGDDAYGTQTGSVSQVRECAGSFTHFAKATGTAVVLVGHVTKDGSLAGPRALEHLVDTVLSFEGDRHHGLRVLAAVKHRFGATGELGLFEMREAGLVSLEDPAGLFLERRPDSPGSVIVPIVEGRRPLLVEVQTLVAETRSGAPRRIAEGVPGSRLALMLAVVESRLGIPTGLLDVFVSTVGGLKVTEPAADLAVALCIVSAVAGQPLPTDLVVFGEIGLSGEVRQCVRAERRLAEAARLGFTAAVAPLGTPDGHPGLAVRAAGSLAEAVAGLGLVRPRTERIGRQPPAALRPPAA